MKCHCQKILPKKYCLTLITTNQWNSSHQDEGQKSKLSHFQSNTYVKIWVQSPSLPLKLTEIYLMTWRAGTNMRTAFLPGTPLKGHTAGCSISLLLQVHEQSRVGAAFAIELFLSLAWVCSDPCAAGFGHECVFFAVPRHQRALEGSPVWTSCLQQHP